LEDLHPNIAVFRRPDHLPDRQELAASFASSFQNMSLDSASIGKMSKETLKGLYGMNDDVILYWAHHEKLCLVDGRTAFMGGLDMCFGRWDTNQHSLSDLHPSDVNQTVFPGQDYNNSRVLDFEDVVHWEKNQLDRKSMSRMGWSDISVSLHGAAVEDLRRHFVERWNFIFDAKYKVRNESRYARLALYGRPTSSTPGQQSSQQPGAQHPNLYPSGQSSPSQPPTPAWQSKPNATSTHLPSGQTSSSSYQSSQAQSHPQQQQQQPVSTGSYQPHQGGSTPTFPPPPGQASSNQYQQYQQSTSPSHQPENVSNHPAPPSYQASAHSSHSPSQGTGQYSYTGNSFPPPPAGPPPAQSNTNSEYQPYPDEKQSQAYHNTGSNSYQSYQAPQQTANSEYQPYADHQQVQTQGATANASYQTYQGQQQEQKPYYAPPPNHGSVSPAPQQNQNQSQTPYYPPPPGQDTSHSNTRGIDDYQYGGNTQYEGDRERGSLAPRRFKEDITQYGNSLRGQLAGQIHQYQDRLTTYGRPSSSQGRGNMSCQIVRSCAKWSNGTPVEHSIADAYCAIIRNSEHFIYIENQFFITATGDSQHPVKNQIGAAIVERILRAARAGQKYKIVVVIPSVPCFAGDLRDDETLGTRAIMEFQYNSINRGGHSIMELIAKEGFNPMEYIRFYNLRNYDRINNGSMVAAAELQSGVNYEDARRQYDQNTAGPGGYAPSTTRSAFDTSAPFQKYQQGAQQAQGSHASSSRWDSVSECYMLGGEDIRKVPWDGHPDAEIDAFVSEELYVHSKVWHSKSAFRNLDNLEEFKLTQF
jgi:phospholipase D1/2